MKRKKIKKLTVVQAARELAKRGIALLRGEDYDLANKTARYKVTINGETKILTSAEIEKFFF